MDSALMDAESVVTRTGDVKLLNRLKRVEGQVRGIHKMIEEGRGSEDILVQLSAVKSALNKVGLNLLERQTEETLAQAVETGSPDKAAKQLNNMLEKWLK
ncbi:hypothetical protein SY83_07040 [Paenibacillus swuensis]|uniref:Transcriptional regulator n=2 Tax=Paenibacillus swuensis TaxID=1178515 RepID=A0A172TNY7_9BACL|nr:hypothetical protein SY83_07040 [Paenibacillus swuensis]